MQNAKPFLRIGIGTWIFLLTFTAGFLNSACLRLFKAAVSHHTGNITHLAALSAHFDFSTFLHLLYLPISFFIGAFISGLLFYTREFRLSKRYGILLMSFSAVFAVIGSVKPPAPCTTALIACILGIQNGMFIFYKGILIRTTHVTGYVTDAALSLGMAVHGSPQELRRSLFYLLSIFCFAFGAFSACIIPRKTVFIIPILTYLFAGFFYFRFRKKELSI